MGMSFNTPLIFKILQLLHKAALEQVKIRLNGGSSLLPGHNAARARTY